MKQQLDAMGVAYLFFPATDGKTITQEERLLYSRKHAFEYKGRELSKGEIGCALTHARIYQQMTDNNIPEVLVLEDDITLPRDLLHVLHRRSAFPENWEVVNFYNDRARPKPFGTPIFDKYRMCKFRGVANRTSAYLINLKGAKKLLKYIYPIRLPADDIIGYPEISGIILYGVAPQAAQLMNFPSDIWDDDDLKGLERYKNLFRAALRFSPIERYLRLLWRLYLANK